MLIAFLRTCSQLVRGSDHPVVILSPPLHPTLHVNYEGQFTLLRIYHLRIPYCLSVPEERTLLGPFASRCSSVDCLNCCFVCMCISVHGSPSSLSSTSSPPFCLIKKCTWRGSSGLSGSSCLCAWTRSPSLSSCISSYSS